MAEKIKRRPPGRVILKWIILVYLALFMVLLIAWGAHLGYHAWHLVGIMQDLQEISGLSQLETMIPEVKQIATDTGAIRNDLSPFFPLFNFLKWLPGIGPSLAQIDPLITYADSLAGAGNAILTGLEPFLSTLPDGQPDRSLPELLTSTLQDSQPQFVTASQLIDDAAIARQEIKLELLPSPVHELFDKVDPRFGQLQSGIQALRVAPALLGAAQPQAYLVLAQNRDELRATGGFISGVGQVVLDKGAVTQFDLVDSYQIDDFTKDYPKPPDALHRFMLADYWVTRDANWSPDFPASAQAAQALYTLSTGHETQGVIAFNQLALKRILEIIGPVSIPGVTEPVTAENIEEYMAQAWAPTPEQGLSQSWWEHRKDFMQELGLAILDKAFSVTDRQQLVSLASTFVTLLEQGHLQVYFNDPLAQAAFDQAGLAGRLALGQGDYLFMVDSNVGFNKVDAVISRSLKYQIDLTDPLHPLGNATLTYAHTGSGSPECKQEISYGNGTYQDMQQRCYLDYWRLYVPGGSELVSGSTQPVPAGQLLNGAGWPGQVETFAGEAGAQVFAGLIMLPPGGSRQVLLSYRLPPSILQPAEPDLQEYDLRVQVQPGLDGLPFMIEVRLPEGFTLVEPGDGWQSISGNAWSWGGVLDQMTTFSLTIGEDP